MTAEEMVTGVAHTFRDEAGKPVLRTVRDQNGMSVYVPGGETSGWILACAVEATNVYRYPKSPLTVLTFGTIMMPEGWSVVPEALAPDEEAIQHGVV